MPTSVTGRSNNSAGFTLIEVAVVVLLIALFAGLTVPMLTGVGQDGMDASARRIAGTVRYLYNEAALTGLQYRLTFDLDDGTFGAKVLGKDGQLREITGTGAERPLKGETRFAEVWTAGRGSFTRGEVTITIYPAGWLEETVLHLKEEERNLTLRLMPFTGATEVYEGYREF